MKKTTAPLGRKTVLYARVSSDEQEKEGFSIPAQTKLLKDYAAREGFHAVGEYVDVETAKKPGRPGFNDMVEFFVKEAKIKTPEQRCRVLLVEKTDRLYRNLKDYITIDDLGIDIHFVKENQIISPESHSSEKFMHGIKVLMAKNYVENLGEEVRKGLREKAEQGIWPRGAPLGYRSLTAPNGKKAIEPDPQTAPLVRQMFEWYATGKYSLKQVAQMAKDAGLPFKRSNNLAALAFAILNNPIYYGDFEWKGKLYRGIHTPLVTKELWQKVQDIMQRRGTRKPRRVKHDFAFVGLLTCGHCGCALTGELKKSKYVYYHCTGYKGKCDEPYVREEELEKKFTEILSTLTFDADVLAWLTEALRQSHVDEKQFHDEAIDRLQAEYKRLQNRIDAMYIDKLDGKVSGAFFEQKSAEWRTEQARVRQLIEEHEVANQSYLDEGIKLLELASRAAELFAKQEPREKRRLLDFVLSNSTWQDGKLTPVFRQPFDMIADAARTCAGKKVVGASSDDLHQSMYAWRDSNPQPTAP